MRSVKYFLVLLLVVVASAAFFAANAAPTNATSLQGQPTLTPRPTRTPRPTATPRPTTTPRPTAGPKPFTITITFQQLKQFCVEARKSEKNAKSETIIRSPDGLLVYLSVSSKTSWTQTKIQVDYAAGKMRFTYLVSEFISDGKVVYALQASQLPTPFTNGLNVLVDKYLLGKVGKNYVVQSFSLTDKSLIVNGVK